MTQGMDIAIIHPGNSRQIYQDLSRDLSAVEPPYLSAVLAQYIRSRGYGACIIDANAENLSPDAVAKKVNSISPLLAFVFVYGTQPSASTQLMQVSGDICDSIKKICQGKVRVAIGGLHPSALPERTMSEEKVDFVVTGEGYFTIERLTAALKQANPDFSRIPGLWYRQGKSIVSAGLPDPAKDIDRVFKSAAWDLLPMAEYRAHNWHCFDNPLHRAPYASIYTSFGCPFSCLFCCINAPFGKPGIRFRSPLAVVDEIGQLADKYSVKNLKIADELFVLKENHYIKIVDLIIERQYDLNIWAYARVDTIAPRNLTKMKKAGINWLALGIESANSKVRDGVSKNIKENSIIEVVKIIQDAGIRVIGNFIFGLPEDDLDTMRQTLDLAKTLNCEFVNFYCAMAYPGSKLYDMAIREKWPLPATWSAYSQHSYDSQPLPTHYLPAGEVLKFRDSAFLEYFSNPKYLGMIQQKFGHQARSQIESMAGIKLRRRLCGN